MAPITLYDSHIVIDAYQDGDTLAGADHGLTSVTAQEFLLMQDGRTAKNRYYVSSIRELAYPGFADAIRRRVPSGVLPHGKRTTDSFLVDVGGGRPTIVEYSHFAVSWVLENRGRGAVELAVAHLDQKQRHDIVDRWTYLMDNQLPCLPLTRRTAVVGAGLLARFEQSYQLKKNFRNSLNDMYQLSIAMSSGGDLLTKDQLLATFAATELPEAWFAPIPVENDNTALPDEPRPRYVNSAWRARGRRP